MCLFLFCFLFFFSFYSEKKIPLIEERRMHCTAQIVFFACFSAAALQAIENLLSCFFFASCRPLVLLDNGVDLSVDVDEVVDVAGPEGILVLVHLGEETVLGLLALPCHDERGEPTRSATDAQFVQQGPDATRDRVLELGKDALVCVWMSGKSTREAENRKFGRKKKRMYSEEPKATKKQKQEI